MTVPTDGHNTTGQFNPALHSTQGEFTVRNAFPMLLLKVALRCRGY